MDAATDEVVVDERAKRAILMSFKVLEMVESKAGDFRFHDQMPLKSDFGGVRVVPGAIARWGSYVASGAILMPSFVNIGGYVDSGTMVDTWATVGSCAQIGKNVHLSGGVGIGGVLEPPNAVPVVIEDDAFIGSRSMVVEGARVRQGAKLGSGTNITKSMRVFDAETGEEMPRGEAPAWSVCVGSTRMKKFPGGSSAIPCLLVLEPPVPRRVPRQAADQRHAPRQRIHRLRTGSDQRMSGLDLTQSAARLTAALVDIESESGNEKALADAVEEALRPYPHLEVLRDGDSVLARTNLGRAERVILAGHLDTVPIAVDSTGAAMSPRSWRATGRPGPARLRHLGHEGRRGGRSWSLAAGLAEPNRDVTYVFYECEEVEAERNSLGRLIRARPEWFAADFAVLLEPSNNIVEGGCQGTMRARLTFRGARAHSARSWLGDNAIHKAGAALRRLEEYQPRRVEVEGLEYREGLNAVGITGGVAGNVIPDECSLAVNFRFAPDRSQDDAERHVREVFADLGAEIVVTDSAPAARPGLHLPSAAEFVGAVMAEVDTEPTAKFGWTDVARFAELGVPGVNYGPGDGSLAHKPDESVDLEQVVRCAERMRSWLGSAP